MAQIFKPYTLTTIDAVISAGKSLKISESSLAFKVIVDDEVAVSYYNVITKYLDVVKPFLRDTELTEEEMLKYKFKPNLYCYDMYGTPELASSLLYVNNMVSVVDFKKKKIKRFASNIMDIVNELLSLNDYELKRNRIENNID